MKTFPYLMTAIHLHTGKRVCTLNRNVAETRTAALEAVNDWNRMAEQSPDIFYRYTLISEDHASYLRREWGGESVKWGGESVNLVLDKSKET